MRDSGTASLWSAFEPVVAAYMGALARREAVRFLEAATVFGGVGPLRGRPLIAERVEIAERLVRDGIVTTAQEYVDLLGFDVVRDALGRPVRLEGR